MPFDPSQGEFVARRLLADPSTTPSDLGVIAGSFPALLTQVAMHPNLYPVLEAWLGQLHRPDIDAALQIRRAQAASGFRPQGPVFVAPPAPTTGTMPSTGLAPTPRLAPVVGAASQAGAPWASGNPPRAGAMPLPGSPSPSSNPPRPGALTPSNNPPLPGAPTLSSEPPLSGNPPLTGVPQPSDPQAVFGVPSVGASPSFSGGLPLAGPVPLPGPLRQSGLAEPPARRRRRGLAIIGAAVTVLALAATAAWFIAVRQHEPLPGDDAVAPDFTAEPVLTELVDLAGVFPGVSALQVEGFLDDTTMLVSSRPGTAIGDSNWYQGYEEDYERGAADAERFDEDYSTWHICVNSSCDGPDCVDRECVEPNRDDYFDYDNYGDFGYQDGYDGNRREVPPAAGEDSTTFLAAVSMDSPTEPKWKLDLNEALGEDALYFDCGYVSLAIDGRGNSLFSVGTEFDALEGDCYWVAVGSGGELLSWARVAPDAIRYAQVVDGLALMDLGGNEYRSRVGAYRLEDLESPVWEADCGGFGCHLATVNGEAWVVTDQGVVDLATGRDVGFDRRLQDWELIVGDGDALFVLDWAGDSEYGGITRAGLDGEDVWDAAVPTSDMVVEVGDGRAYVPRGEAMVGVDAETGEERWSTAVGQVIWFCVAGNGNLAVALAADADRLAIIDGESGEVLGDGLPGVLMACGEEMVYATDADGNAQARLVGYSAQAGQAGQAAPDADGRELWSVALPEGASTVPLMTPGQRMYYVAAQYGAEAGMGNGNGSRREAEALRLDSLIVYRVDHK